MKNTKRKSCRNSTGFSFWQGQKDSNPQQRFWRPTCYHYTMPLRSFERRLLYTLLSVLSRTNFPATFWHTCRKAAYFFTGSSMRVARLYSAQPSFLLWRLSAMGMLTQRNKTVLAAAPAMRYQSCGNAHTTLRPTPHHMLISPR